ncbi:hypothetical protein [Micromonospora sp. KC213]|uniref:hypothetical protein n=1 Tax=Micromonospora sp. KC213 TaxID=2530378 RepID=UPI001045835B|nr:hypothetical protein [Micromonospora sp. KC213]TDC29970.1 hypothetical protein E1166_29375 [Micromonospora sp. KC213]
MTDPLAELSARMAEAHGLDPLAFEARVRRQLARRIARAAQPFKPCPDCGEELPARAFAEDAAAADGLQRRCRPCDASRSAARRSTSPDPGPLT